MRGKPIDKFVSDQLSVWPLVSANYRALKGVKTRSMDIGGLTVRLQCNPSRIGSSDARTDAETVNSRKCLLCASNRPPQQASIPFEGRKGRRYDIILNPYPIFPGHLVAVRKRHVPQSIWHNFVDMLDLSRQYQDHTIFYNGPASGASIPEHLHFQACPRHSTPLENEIDGLLPHTSRHQDFGPLEYMTSIQDAWVFHYKKYLRGIFALRAKTAKSMAKLFYRVIDCAKIKEGDKEPRFNLYVWFTDGEYRSVIIFREKHRSHHYFSKGEDHLTMSPGCADMAGVLVCPVGSEYERLGAETVREMLDEVCISPSDEEEIIWKLQRRQPKIQVGIMSAKEITFEIISDGAGPQKVSFREGKIDYNGVLYDELFFGGLTRSAIFAEPSFILYGVTIGKQFHWERKVDQKFAGRLKFIVENGMVTAVNIVGVEDYLLSVISSEMRASASLEFLKAHAVISRSWLMAIVSHRGAERKPPAFVTDAAMKIRTEASLVTFLDSVRNSGKVIDREAGKEVPEFISWQDHEDHSRFDVCADDHCQRYQGLTMAVGENVRKAVDQTWGEVLTYGGEICDARFSKCCGGIMEEFHSCWEDKEVPYLQALPDTPGHDPAKEPFCKNPPAEILSQVLNDYDLETKDFYRWSVTYEKGELSELISRRSGHMIGELEELVPLERGKSGRITKLKVVGSAYSMVVGKELAIRRILSESHLKSSAFDVSRPDAEHFTLSGKGWGHGVGLCQIGAAVMAARGYGYKDILDHYYPGAEIKRQQ